MITYVYIATAVQYIMCHYFWYCCEILPGFKFYVVSYMLFLN